MDGPYLTDFSPGENHIALKYPNKCFYVPEVFHLSPTIDKTIPLFITDINTSKPIRDIYGVYGNNYQNCLIINNYPIRKFRVFGKIIGEMYKGFDGYGKKSTRNFILITLDDFSSDKYSTIRVKVPESIYLASGLMFNESYGKIIEINGCINEFNRIKEIHSDFIHVIGENNEIDIEIENWKKTLKYRNENLIEPWVYNPSSAPISNQTLTSSNLSQECFESNKRLTSSQLSNLDFIVPDSSRENSFMTAYDEFQHEENEIEEQRVDFGLDSSVQIIQVNEVPIQCMTEFQLSLEFISWIIRNNFEPFRLIEIYKDFSINGLLDSLTNLRLTTGNSHQQEKPFNILKQEIFHSIRHNLQVNYKLIKVTKSQKVKSKNLQFLYNHLKQCLIFIKTEKIKNKIIKILNIENYLNNLETGDLVGSDINYKLINGIIDFIIINDFNDKTEWKYDSKTIQWVYIGGND